MGSDLLVGAKRGITVLVVIATALLLDAPTFAAARPAAAQPAAAQPAAAQPAAKPRRPAHGPSTKSKHGQGHHGSTARPPSAPGPDYQNPVGGQVADPDVLNDNATNNNYYLYSTGDLFPIERSSDLIHWRAAGTAFDARPSWVFQTGDWHPWGPSVIEAAGLCPLNSLFVAAAHHEPSTGNCYYMYYTGDSRQFDTNCVAVATSVSPDGPFVDQGPLSNGTLDAAGRPIGCGDNAGYGNIDPDPFIDTDGQEYLYVSTDTTCPAGATSCTGANSTLQPTISVMAMAANHIAVVGARVELFNGTEKWERSGNHKTVEGPWMDEHDGVYDLFFSGGDWMGSYGEGDATLAAPMGPVVTQDPANPLLTGTKKVFSPGGGSTVIGPHGGEWLVYHARVGSVTAPRVLFISPITWPADGMPTIGPATTAPQSPLP